MKRVKGLGILLLMIAGGVQADQVRVPVGQQTAASEVRSPSAGMKKVRVEQEFGAPIRRRGPVGDPAIYRWEYSDYVVYFENDTVLRTVVKHRPQTRSN